MMHLGHHHQASGPPKIFTSEQYFKILENIRAERNQKEQIEAKARFDNFFVNFIIFVVFCIFILYIHTVENQDVLYTKPLFDIIMLLPSWLKPRIRARAQATWY